MPMNARHIAAAAALTLGALGCAAKSNQDMLPGAVYAAKVVPVYRNSVLTNMMGNETYGDEPGSYTQGQSWSFEVKDPKAKVLAFYEQKFPGAERTTNNDGSVTLRVVPEGAEKNEYVYVTVEDGEIRIGEHCRPGKIRS
jgi:hypothetical protein